MKHVIRQWRRSPGTAIAILTILTLGTGIPIALMAIVDQAVFRPLPYRNPHELVQVTMDANGRVLPRPNEFVQIAETVRAFADVAAVQVRPRYVDNGSGLQPIAGIAVTSSYFDVLGAGVLAGRTFTAHEHASQAPVALVSESYWRRTGLEGGGVLRFADGVATVVGVAPDAVMRRADVVFPATVSPTQTQALTVVGRLRPGLTIEQAGAQMERMTADGRLPIRSGQGPSLRPLTPAMSGARATTAKLLFFAGLAALLLAAANVAALIVSTGLSRLGEFGLRSALGASRSRLVWDLLGEIGTLVIIGCMLGGGLSVLVNASLATALPFSLHPGVAGSARTDMLLASVAVCAGLTIFIGLLPIALLSRVDTSNTIGGADGPRVTAHPWLGRGRALLFGGQVALSLTLVSMTFTFATSAQRLSAIDLGFSPSSMVVAELRQTERGAVTPDTDFAMLTVGALPLVEAVGAVDNVPLGGGQNRIDSGAVTPLDGVTKTVPSDGWEVRRIAGGYFPAIGVAPTEGVVPGQPDGRLGPEDVVLSETARVALFNDQPAVGRFLLVERRPRRVVAVVPDVLSAGPSSTPSFEIYLAPEPGGQSPLALVIRPRPGAADIDAAIRRALAGVLQPGAAVLITRGDASLDTPLVVQSARAALFGALGLFGVLLAAVGVFSMVSLHVARRRRELLIREWLGARRFHIWSVGVQPVVWPLILGHMSGVVTVRLLAPAWDSLLFRTSADEPTGVGVAAVLLFLTASTAAGIALRRSHVKNSAPELPRTTR